MTPTSVPGGAAVDADQRAGDARRLVAGQQHGHGGDLLDGHGAFKGGLLGEQVCELLEAQPHARRGDWPGLADALGDHQAGADGVDGDAQRPGLLGGALFALGKTAAYAKTRVVWGDTPIGAHQGVAHPLAQAAVQVELARLMAQKAAWLYDTGDDTRATAAGNMAKLAADAADAADQAVQTHGGGGLASEHGLARLLASARTARAAPVSREMILNFVAQHTLGLPKSY